MPYMPLPDPTLMDVRVGLLPCGRSDLVLMVVGQPGVLEALGWRIGDTRVACEWGYGEDVGRVALRPRPAGAVLQRSNRTARSWRVTFARLPAAPLEGVAGARRWLLLERRPLAICPWEVLPDGRSLALALPGGWWACIGDGRDAYAATRQRGAAASARARALDRVLANGAGAPFWARLP